MSTNFTSVILENGLVPIASSVQKRLRLRPGVQVRISIKVLDQSEQKKIPPRVITNCSLKRMNEF